VDDRLPVDAGQIIPSTFRDSSRICRTKAFTSSVSDGIRNERIYHRYGFRLDEEHREVGTIQGVLSGVRRRGRSPDPPELPSTAAGPLERVVMAGLVRKLGAGSRRETVVDQPPCGGSCLRSESVPVLPQKRSGIAASWVAPRRVDPQPAVREELRLLPGQSSTNSSGAGRTARRSRLSALVRIRPPRVEPAGRRSGEPQAASRFGSGSDGRPNISPGVCGVASVQ
jgi:hypothetical protein